MSNCATCGATPDMCCCNSTRTAAEARKGDGVAEFLLEVAKHQGVAVLTVKDGWVLMFSRDKVTQMYEAMDNSSQEFIAVHVQSSGKLEATGAVQKN